MIRIGAVARFALAALVVPIAWVAPAGAAPEKEKARNAWDAIYVKGSKVGHTHIWVEPTKDGHGKDLVRVRVDYEVSFKRDKDEAPTRVMYGTIETPEGSVLRLDTRTQASNGTIRMHGDVIDGKMNLSIEAGGQSQHEVIPWGPEVRGPYGAEMSLTRQPIKSGEAREVKTYVPDLNQVCTTKLEAKGKETVVLGQGVRLELLRVEQSLTDPKGKLLPEMNTTLWVDDQGQILKSHTDLLGGMDSYRTTERAAKAPNGGGFDLLTILKVGRPIRDSEKSRDIVYQVTMKDGNPLDLIPADRRQSIRKGNAAGTATVEIRTAGPNEGETGPDQVDAEYVRSNPLVNSEDAVVVEHTRKAVGGLTDPWEKAVAIEKWVAQNLRNKNFNIAFAPAAEVARDLAGDCTEHGVLTAAMCRAAGIPSRCVIGLVYVEPKRGFGFHMWNEVYVNRRWVAIDSTFDQAQVDATHLKLAATSLDGVSPFAAFMPVLTAFDKLTIEPVEVR
jgi:hypothetical protein